MRVVYTFVTVGVVQVITKFVWLPNVCMVVYTHSVGVRGKPRNCIWHFIQEAKKITYFDLKLDLCSINIEQFVKERREIKPLRTCVSTFFEFSKKIDGGLSFTICLTKTVYVDTRFSTRLKCGNVWHRMSRFAALRTSLDRVWVTAEDLFVE